MQQGGKPNGDDQHLLEDAARTIFDAMEKAGVVDKAATFRSSSSEIVQTNKYLILSAAKKGTVTLYGTRLPGRVLRSISQGELDGVIPIKDTNILRPPHTAMRTTDLVNVRIPSADLERLIAARREAVQADARQSLKPVMLLKASADNARAIVRHQATVQDETNFRNYAKEFFERNGVGPSYRDAEKWAADAGIVNARKWARKMRKLLPPEHRRKRGSGTPLTGTDSTDRAD